MTYRPWVPNGPMFPGFGAVYICSQDGNLVVDREQHTAHHKYQSQQPASMRREVDIGDLAEELQEEIDQSHVELAHADEVANDRGGFDMHEHIRQLNNRVEEQRIRLETQENTHRQDVELRKKLDAKLALADEITDRLAQSAKITTDTDPTLGVTQHYTLRSNYLDRAMTRLVMAYQELSAR